MVLVLPTAAPIVAGSSIWSQSSTVKVAKANSPPRGRLTFDSERGIAAHMQQKSASGNGVERINVAVAKAEVITKCLPGVDVIVVKSVLFGLFLFEMFKFVKSWFI